MSFLLKKDESLLAPSTDLSTFLNKKDSILDRDDNPMLEIVFKHIELDSSDLAANMEPIKMNESKIDVQLDLDKPEADEVLTTDGNTPKVIQHYLCNTQKKIILFSMFPCTKILQAVFKEVFPIQGIHLAIYKMYHINLVKFLNKKRSAGFTGLGYVKNMFIYIIYLLSYWFLLKRQYFN